MRTRTKTIGGTYRFTYPYYGTPETHPDYRAHSNQLVTIIRQLTNKECDPECQPMWRIRASDGWMGSASSSELRTPSKPKKPKRKTVYVVVRMNTALPNVSGVCTTFDRATYQCDKLTKKFGPTFIIIEAPLDP